MRSRFDEQEPFDMNTRILLFGLQFGVALASQAQGYGELNVNNLSARFYSDGMIGMDIGSGTARFEVPNGSGTHPMFVANLWMGGIDSGNQLHLAAVRYNQNGEDFWPGPLTNTGGASITPAVSAQWDQVWQVNTADVTLHLAYMDCLNDPSCDETVLFPGYQIPAYFFDWPAIGDVAQGQDLYLAPFLDYNSDGDYDPADGDVPCPLGDGSLFFIFNDKLDVHTESGGLPIGVEVQARPFAFSGASDALNNTVFVEYRIINRSTLTLNDVHVGLFTDFDLGGPQDDHIGCDVGRSLWYVYNADTLDEGTTGILGYGTQPPAFGATILCGMFRDGDGLDNPLTTDANLALAQQGSVYPGWGDAYSDSIPDNERYGLSHFGAFPGSGGMGTMDPQNAAEYYNYMRGAWADGSSWLYGGIGHLSDPAADPNTTTNHLFPSDSDPLGFSTSAVPQVPWNQVSAGHVGGDRRGVGSMGPFTLEPGDIHRVMVAFVYARATNGGPEASVVALQARVDSVRAFAVAEDFCGGFREDRYCSFGLSTGIVQASVTAPLQLHPVPASDVLQITGPVGATFVVVDLSGSQVLPVGVFAQGRTAVNVSGLPNGVYVMRTLDPRASVPVRFVVAR